MAGQSAQRTLLQERGGSSPTYTWTTIAQMTNIEDETTSDDLETTDMLSQAKEYVPALPDNGSVTLDLNFDPAATQHQTLRSSVGKVSAKKTYRIFYSTPPLVESGSQAGYATEFQAYPKSWKTKAKSNEVLTATVEFKVSGAMTELDAATTTI
jgi:hypothetical protein